MPTPVQIVQRQLDAYNACDLEAFMATYAPDAKVHLGLGPDAKVIGATEMRQRYGERFRTPGLHCELLARMSVGTKVVDREHVTATGLPPLEAIVIYQVREGLIQEAWILGD